MQLNLLRFPKGALFSSSNSSSVFLDVWPSVDKILSLLWFAVGPGVIKGLILDLVAKLKVPQNANFKAQDFWTKDKD